MLEFIKDTHTYVLDGEVIPSVSEVCRFISREIYDDSVPKAVLDEAADRGTRVHEATYALDECGTCECGEDIAGYVKAYKKFLEEHDVKWVLKEDMSKFADVYAGTLDRLGKLDGKDTLLDIKTTSTISAKHKLLYTAQLNCYERLDNVFSWYEEPDMKVLQLKPDGEYKLIDIPDDTVLWSSLVSLDGMVRKTKRKRKVKSNG